MDSLTLEVYKRAKEEARRTIVQTWQTAFDGIADCCYLTMSQLEEEVAYTSHVIAGMLTPYDGCEEAMTTERREAIEARRLYLSVTKAALALRQAQATGTQAHEVGRLKLEARTARMIGLDICRRKIA